VTHIDEIQLRLFQARCSCGWRERDRATTIGRPPTWRRCGAWPTNMDFRKKKRWTTTTRTQIRRS